MQLRMGSASVSLAVIGVPPMTSAACATLSRDFLSIHLAGGTPANASETLALPTSHSVVAPEFSTLAPNLRALKVFDRLGKGWESPSGSRHQDARRSAGRLSLMVAN
jgi:hypothetical protein